MSSNMISAQRTEMMVVAPNSRMLQIARFLAPTFSMQTPPDRPTRPTSTISSLSPDLQKVNFVAWVDPISIWTVWVDAMKPAHGPGWKAVGIYDAIMHSILHIPKNESLVLWFAEKWSPQTNTFVLPWGEITITLEDMMVLGGFSVLGGPATCHVERPEDRIALNKLNKAYRKLVKPPGKKVTFSAWMNKFMSRQKAHEHEAFLALWLSKYLFASVKDTISHETFHLAILLARGRRIALAPAVLATLYRDMHFLKNAILDVQQGVTETVTQEVFSPMYYLQVWIWERFPFVGPRALHNDETRLHRWDRLNKAINFGRLDNDTRKECFLWRPYAKDTNHFISQRVYDKYGSWRTINNEEVESYARCLRACKLVGLDIIQDIIQDYSPHRVCRQFGYAQDIPADVLQIEDNEAAWVDYSTQLLNGNVYIPSREFEGHVSARYEEWWEREPVSPSDPRVPLPPKRRRKRIRSN